MEKFYTVFLTREDVHRLRSELAGSQEDITWKDYPRLDALTDAIVGLEDQDLLAAEEI